MKNGLIFENGELIYYKDGSPHHAGVIKSDGDIYYIGSGGRAVKGEHAVHRTMSNGILKRGTYKFGEDYKLVEGYYIAPEKRKTKHNKKKKKNLWILVTCFVVFAAILLASLLSSYVFDNHSSTDVSSSYEIGNIIVHAIDSEVLLCSEDAKKFYDNEITAAQAIQSGSPYRAFQFKYSISVMEDGLLKLSENSDLSDCKEYVLPFGSKSLSIDNLKVNTTYYYRAECGEDTVSGEFKTAASARYLSISGVYNVRDIGGCETVDGKTVKQGYIIRGTEIDGLVESSYFLENEYVDHVAEEFGFVCDFDLRGADVFSGNYVSRLGENVKHNFYNAPFYGNIFNVTNKQFVKDIFSALADESNYPMYMHCTYGSDRTGTVVFLLQGILNVSEADMIKEYRQTGFFQSAYASISNIEVVIQGLKSYEGETLNEKIENFLISDIGVTREEIESIRNILLEDQ